MVWVCGRQSCIPSFINTFSLPVEKKKKKKNNNNNIKSQICSHLRKGWFLKWIVWVVDWWDNFHQLKEVANRKSKNEDNNSSMWSKSTYPLFCLVSMKEWSDTFMGIWTHVKECANVWVDTLKFNVMKYLFKIRVQFEALSTLDINLRWYN